jgi:acetyl esterase/lipase
MLGLGVISCAIFLLPLATVPHTIRNADSAFREAFGDAANESSRPEFMRHPFSLQDYFFGVRTGNFHVIENVLFFEGMTGVDAGLRLYYDVYMPITDASDLPGQNAILIRIHGGAWVTGSNGSQNYAAINKHFAEQGYVVFDIQYGLNNLNDSLITAAVPAHVRGNFDIDDMVRHIGIFTTHLADNAHRYNADLSNVFITGGSAGGQLATAAALGITGGRYTDILDERLHIRGLIPVYPANGLAPSMGIGGTPDLVDPVLLLDEKSPPVLIFQGTHDGVVPPHVATTFLEAHRARSNTPGAIIWLNFAGHGSDFYTPGYFNQVFLYFMERFMYQFRE